MSHKVIVIPGLGDESRKIKWATNHYRRYGLDPLVHNVWWRKGEKHFKPKLQKLINIIDKLAKNGDRISLIGISAGSSAALNAFVARKNKIHKVVSICGRLKRGEEKGFCSFETRTAGSLAFKESVLVFEKSEPKLMRDDRMKIMTIRALFDELVPDNTAYIKGVTNKKVKSVEHVFSIWMGLRFYKPLIDFLRN